MSKIKVNILETSDGFEQISTTNVVNGSAKAWLNFNGTGIVAIRESFNVASLLDVGTGAYRVNLNNVFSSDNIAPVNTGTWGGGPYLSGHGSFAATKYDVITGIYSGAGADSPYITSIIHGDLA